MHLLSGILEAPGSGAAAVLHAICVDPQGIGRELARASQTAPAMLNQ
jgi:hypothetical protein